MTTLLSLKWIVLTILIFLVFWGILFSILLTRNTSQIGENLTITPIPSISENQPVVETLVMIPTPVIGENQPIGENLTITPIQSIYITLPIQEFYSCDRDSGYISNNYEIYNNFWGKDRSGETYAQCIWVNSPEDPFSVSAGWNWWPGPKGDGGVKAYPTIIYGWAPWLPTSTDAPLPVQLSKMGSYLASFDVSVIASKDSIYNTAFDIWITSAAQPTPENRTKEVMIWVNHQNMPQNFTKATNSQRVTIDGDEYDYGYWDKQGTHDYIKFVKVVPQITGSIFVDHFLIFLMEEGYISVDEYLADIEFGNEIVFGTGHTIIRSYSVTPSD